MFIVGAVSILDCITIEESEVITSINKLKSNLSAGPDGFPPVQTPKTVFVCVLNAFI